MTFAPVDFESQTLIEGLARAGFDAGQPAFFSWLGVVPYLTRSAAMETFRFVGSLPAGSAIVFDYALPPESLSLVQRLALKALADRVAAAGEPFQTFFEPSALTSELRPMGFGSFEDLGTEEINARYFSGRSDGLQRQRRDRPADEGRSWIGSRMRSESEGRWIEVGIALALAGIAWALYHPSSGSGGWMTTSTSAPPDRRPARLVPLHGAEFRRTTRGVC